MSSAFIKEDVEVVERPMLRRSSSGLPPGALNLMTAEGAEILSQRIDELRQAQRHDPAIAQLEAELLSATIVRPTAGKNSIVFGSTVHLQNDSGEKAVYRIVGVNEAEQNPHYVSWLSPLGKTLLGSGGLRARVSLTPDQKSVWIVTAIE